MSLNSFENFQGQSVPRFGRIETKMKDFVTNSNYTRFVSLFHHHLEQIGLWSFCNSSDHSEEDHHHLC